MTVYLSGIQPSGLLHFGNYFGAIRRQIELQNEPDAELFYFVADYHALTTSRDPEQLREWVREVAVTYLALGLDPEKVALFRQSEVPEVTELTWFLSTVTGVGLLERAVSYKDKVARGLKPNVGLFLYPILQAADILAYDANFVPVGGDQVQHIEMTRDMASTFNQLYGDVFTLPEALVGDIPKVPGLDGDKMSKSYDNHVWVFETGKALKKRIGRITTDSREPEEPKDPGGVLLLSFLELFLEPGELAEWRERVSKGGEGAPGYGHLKVRLIEAVEETFAPARARRAELLADPAEVDRVLARGAERARARAAATRDRALRASGLR